MLRRIGGAILLVSAVAKVCHCWRRSATIHRRKPNWGIGARTIVTNNPSKTKQEMPFTNPSIRSPNPCKPLQRFPNM